MTNKEIHEVYEIVKDYYEKYLQKRGVKLPKLKNVNNKFTKDALVLVYLARFYPSTVVVTKGELTSFIRKFFRDVNDVQQARHLGAQKGWYISSGGRDNVHVKKIGEYRLITLERPYPHFTGHRIEATGDWGKVKKQYGNRCATCGSEEGKRNFHWTNTITKLQKSHINPSNPLTEGNIFPQCQKCNRAYRNFWIFDEKGRVRGISNPIIIKKCKNGIRKSIYKILYNEYKGENPNQW